MTMQHNIDIFGRNIRRNVHQPKLQTLPREIGNQRPICIPVAVSANDRQRRTDCFEIECDRRLANIAQMPDLVRVVRKIENLLGQLVMGVRDNQHAHCFNQSAP